MATCKFKVGDMVIGNHPTKYGITNTGWIGKVTKVNSGGTFSAKGKGFLCAETILHDLEPQYFDLYEPKKSKTADDKIVITHNGKTTTAKLIRKDGTCHCATANCAPEDEFDFMVGAKLALERLEAYIEEIEKPKYWTGRVVCTESDPTMLSCDSFTVGKIYKVDNGRIIDNQGEFRPMNDIRITNPKDLTKGYYKTWGFKFIPIVE